jgi:hypothetical protein
VVEGFSISVAGKTLFDNADLRFSGIRQHTSAYVSICQHTGFSISVAGKTLFDDADLRFKADERLAVLTYATYADVC